MKRTVETALAADKFDEMAYLTLHNLKFKKCFLAIAISD
jgi:hypothetical protein